jgi:hypothetical protein
MMLIRRSAGRSVRHLGAFCLAALMVGVAPRPGPALAQPRPAAQAAGPGLESSVTPPGVPAPIEGFRQARFGMNEAELRQAIRRDFPAAAARISRTTQPGEKTAVLAITAETLLPDAGPARLFYILGYASKRLVQVNITWSSDGRTAERDEAIVAAANTLRDHFQTEHPGPPEEVVANQQVGENAILVFRVAQPDGRMVLLLLSGVAAGRAGRLPTAAPLTLQLSYILDHKSPDIFRIESGRF